MHALNYLYEVLFSLKRETRGAVASEYAFLIVFIAIVAVAGMFTLGTGLSDYFGAYGNAIGNAASQS
ncbi:MAG: Flp family type IVb pilin [Alphaproteobacteria bacterium]|nr:Flp family type IVb pilin [Alphaproteobacteria bacterium]